MLLVDVNVFTSALHSFVTNFNGNSIKPMLSY